MVVIMKQLVFSKNWKLDMNQNKKKKRFKCICSMDYVLALVPVTEMMNFLFLKIILFQRVWTAASLLCGEPPADSIQCPQIQSPQCPLLVTGGSFFTACNRACSVFYKGKPYSWRIHIKIRNICDQNKRSDKSKPNILQCIERSESVHSNRPQTAVNLRLKILINFCISKRLITHIFSSFVRSVSRTAEILIDKPCPPYISKSQTRLQILWVCLKTQTEMSLYSNIHF